jgi:hypothetical protein
MTRTNALRVTRAFVQTLCSRPEAVFPLLCPVREGDWLEGWDCRVVYSDSGVAEAGCVFTTAHHGDTETVWYTTDHESPRRVRFVRVTPGFMTVEIEILLAPLGRDGTQATIHYTYTALGPQGQDALERSTEEEWLQMMEWWERSMNHYLQTGERLRHAP